MQEIQLMAKKLQNKISSKQPRTVGKMPHERGRNWRTIGIVAGVVSLFAVLYIVRPENPTGAGGHSTSAQNKVTITAPERVPDTHLAGVKLFTQNCAQCHGEWAGGTDSGPPLIHGFYRPSHHSDFAFYKAAKDGVRAHHWNFGDMQPVASVTRADMDKIIPFIRWWQSQNGIS